MVIFIVDDSKQIRDSLKTIINDIPGAKIAGETGKKSEVIQCIQEHSPDFVILDLRLDTGNSFDLIRKIKNIDTKIKIAVFSNFTYLLYKNKCSELGADYFFEKSMESYKLILLIEKLSMEEGVKRVDAALWDDEIEMKGGAE